MCYVIRVQRPFFLRDNAVRSGNSHRQVALDLSQPARQPVPTGAVLVHQTFISGSDFPQVAEGRCGYAGSNKAISVERDSIRKEQLLEPLTLVERRCTQNRRGAEPLCNARSLLHRVHRAGRVTVIRASVILAQLLGVTVVRLDVDGARSASSRRFSLSCIALAARSALAISSLTAAFLAFQICSTDSLRSRM